MERIREVLSVSERRVCKVLGQPRTTQRYKRRPREDEDELTGRIIELATRFGRYGYRRITALLKAEGWRVNHKRVERIWRGKASEYPRSSPREAGYGSMTAPVSGFALSIGTTSGHTTLSTREHMTAGSCGS